MSMIRCIILTACVLIGLACESTTIPVSTTADTPVIGLQLMLIDPALRSQRFSVLLGFESDVDLAFVSGQPSLELADAHTGKACLPVAPGVATRIKLSSVMSGRAFPGDWTLVGGYLKGDRDGSASVALVCGGKVLLLRRLTVPAGTWTPAFLDLTRLPRDAVCHDAVLEIRCEVPLRCDDVSVIQNQTWLVGGQDDPSAPWTLSQRGFSIFGEAPGFFTFSLDTVECSPSGWQVREASHLRAVFDSPGMPRTMTVYNDGRRYIDGESDPISSQTRNEPLLRQSHLQPCEVRVDESVGRLVRNSAGDANNDGYNESLGSFQLWAAGSRFEAVIVPGGSAVFHPVLEIAGLPAGKALVTLDGKLIDSHCRTPSGKLLVDLPVRIDRTVSISVRVE